MNKILLDSSVIIDFLRIRDKKSTIFYKVANGNHKLFVSIITHAELYAGKSVWETKIARDELESLFSKIQIINLNEELSKKAGEIKAKYGIDLLDAIIAATALVHKLDFATLNIKDFASIERLKLYSPHRF